MAGKRVTQADWDKARAKAKKRAAKVMADNAKKALAARAKALGLEPAKATEPVVETKVETVPPADSKEETTESEPAKATE